MERPIGQFGGEDLAAGAPVRSAADATVNEDRRGRTDRRVRIWWSLMYGSFNPRRRNPARRVDESRFHSLDWHSPHLLAVSLAIVLLSVADAFMTVTLMNHGAIEVNPLMAVFVTQSPTLFASVKMTMTGIGVMLMVLLAHYRFMRLVRVDVVMYALLCGYVALLSYEFWMLGGLGFPVDM